MFSCRFFFILFSSLQYLAHVSCKELKSLFLETVFLFWGYTTYRMNSIKNLPTSVACKCHGSDGTLFLLICYSFSAEWSHFHLKGLELPASVHGLLKHIQSCKVNLRSILIKNYAVLHTWVFCINRLTAGTPEPFGRHGNSLGSS
jgi:hypothetical protein